MLNKRLTAKAVIFGVLIAFTIAIIMICILSAVVMTSGLLPAELISIITVVFLAMGTFAGGFIAARIAKSGGLITGAITGLVVFLIVTIVGLTRSDDVFSLLTLIKFGATLVGGAIGGIIGVNKKEKIQIK
jgi:putative membrane protein (TIGR04086 family)